MIRTWTTVAYRDIETGTTIDGRKLDSLVESELSQGSLGTRNACTTLYHEWLDSHHTASQIVTAGESRVRQEFIRELFENEELLRRLGYEPITVPGEDVIITQGLLACGNDEHGKNVSIELAYVPATGGYILDICHDRQSFRAVLDSKALTYMTQEIKELRKLIRERK